MSQEDSTPVVTEEVFTPGASTEPTSILAVCKQHLDGKGFNYSDHVGPERTLIKAAVGGINGSYDLVMDIKEEKKLLIIYVRSTLRFPAARRGKLAEYLTRSNYGLVLGNFEMDMNDGEIRYKCSIPTVLDEEGNTSITDPIVDRMMQTALLTMDRYFEAMVQVGYGIKDPKEAVESVENGDSYAEGALQQLMSAASGESGASSSSTDSNPTNLMEGLRQLVSQMETSGAEDPSVASSQ